VCALSAPRLSGTIAGMASFTQTTDEESIMAGYRIDVEGNTRQEAHEYERKHHHG
jgi:hypothetical protein